MKTVEELCKEYNVNLIDLRVYPEYASEVNMPIEHFANRSFCIGSKEIVVGLYEDDELRYVSALHELGHILGIIDKKEGWPYHHEVAAWKWAMDKVHEEKIKLVPKTIQWCNDQLLTYFKKEKNKDD